MSYIIKILLPNLTDNKWSYGSPFTFFRAYGTYANCVIPAIPFFFLVGLYYLKDNQNDMKRYIKGSIYTFTLYVSFLLILYFSYNVSNDLIVSSIISILFYLLFLFIIWNFI